MKTSLKIHAETRCGRSSGFDRVLVSPFPRKQENPVAQTRLDSFFHGNDALN